MAYTTIIFDLDGTLMESAEGIINSAIPPFHHFGLPVPSYEDLLTFVGPPLWDSFIKYGIPEKDADEAIRIYRARYTTIGKFECHPFDGTHALLQRLRDAGLRLFIATSKPENMALEITDRFELAPYFECIAGASLDASRRTKEDVLAYLLEQAGSVEQAVMIGDTEFDVLGAAQHGIPTIGVSWGYGKVKDMEQAGAAAIVHTMDELCELVIGATS